MHARTPGCPISILFLFFPCTHAVLCIRVWYTPSASHSTAAASAAALALRLGGMQDHANMELKRSVLTHCMAVPMHAHVCVCVLMWSTFDRWCLLPSHQLSPVRGRRIAPATTITSEQPLGTRSAQNESGSDASVIAEAAVAHLGAAVGSVLCSDDRAVSSVQHLETWQPEAAFKFRRRGRAGVHNR